ncbi:unnamed protein product [Camellia sinensis]
MDKPAIGVVTKAQIVDYYTQLLTTVMGTYGLKDAQMCIYHISWQSDFEFCCELDKECARELAGVPGENLQQSGNAPDSLAPNEIALLQKQKPLSCAGLMQEIYGASCYFIEAESMNKKKCLVTEPPSQPYCTPDFHSGASEGSFVKKSVVSMLSGKKPVQAVPAGKKGGAVKSSVNKQGDAVGQLKTSKPAEPEDVDFDPSLSYEEREKRKRQAAERAEAIKCMHHSKRTMLTTDDVDSALILRNVELIYGFASGDPLRFRRTAGHKDLFFIDDKDLGFKDEVVQQLHKPL